MRTEKEAEMSGKAMQGAALLCVLCSIWGPASAQNRKVAQNVQYVICVTTTESASRCKVQEPVEPCPKPSAEDFPKKHYATVREACSEAKKRSECRGDIAGC
jgi:hypothetical protein